MDNPPDLAELGVTLTDLIALIEGAGHGNEDALTRLPAAVAIGEQLGELGDHLVGHFVDQARHEGASWTAIGASMGVTKQAAQKKFVPGPGDVPAGRIFNRFTPRASKAVEVARKAAGRMKNRGVGTEHLVLGLVATGGVAAEVMHAQGVSSGEVRKAVHAAAAPSIDELPDPIPFAPETKRALEVATREALRRGHNYIGTEHLLLAVLADPDSVGSRVLTSLGITAAETSERIDRMLAEMVATEPF
ncbi:MAG TPA: hypothetical protein DCQ30_07425 [Acidimicrobiaceae bacterium]|nr:hypothetical protein [Acidimicrobiaceae bacterium]